MSKEIIRDLGDGLIIRHATPEDAEPLAKFNKEIHGEGEWDGKGLEDWTLDLISGDGPTFDTGDFIIVEETASGEIISTSCLISQTWSFEGIPVKVGRPELVATKKEYRQRGLIRKQFEILHAWSEERGELFQAITGIPYYYRLFGYEMTLDLGGGRSGFQTDVPKLKEGEEETHTFRVATAEDIPFLMETYNTACQRWMVHAVWDQATWHHEITGKRQYNIDRREIYIIENNAGQPVGFIGIPPIKWGPNSTLTVYELSHSASWAAVTPSVIRFLWEKGEALGKEQGEPQNMFGFWLGGEHPAYDVVASRLTRESKPYAFFIRVPDLTAFIKKIAPVLEARLVGSAFAHYHGKVKLNFYRDGLNLSFNNGRLEEIKTFGLEGPDSSTGAFSPLVFLNLLFGHRSMEELHHIYPDCYASSQENRNLINTLFPKKPSEVWSIA